MNQITAVFQHSDFVTIAIGHEDGRETNHIQTFSSRAQRKLFSLVISYLEREVARKHGFFSITTYGWHWLRYTDGRGA